jgi:hypothetical protein
MNITKENQSEFLLVNVPEMYSDFKLVHYGYAGTYIMETNSTGLNHWKMHIPKGNYELIGFVDLDFTNKNYALKPISYPS